MSRTETVVTTKLADRPFGKQSYLLIGDDRKACCTMLFNMLKLQRARNRDVFPGANPVSIERGHIANLHVERYWVAPKTDGDRALLMTVTHKSVKLSLLIDRSMNMYIATGNFPTSSFDNSLLDGELVKMPDSTWRYLVFDCIYLAGIDLSSHKFSVRLDMVRSWMEDMGTGPDGMVIDVKTFAVVGGGSIPAHQGMPDDGLIFVPEHKPYGCYRNDHLLKWKPAGHHTVDFQVGDSDKLLVASKSKLIEKGHLHVADRQGVEKGQIVECRLVGQDWRVVRVRHDKVAPNDQYVLGKTVLNMQENIQRSEFRI